MSNEINWKKIAFRWTVLVAFFFAVGFTYQYHLPQIESFLLVKVEDLAAKRSPMQILPARLKLTLFPLGVVLEDVKVIPKKELAATLAPARLQEVAIGLSVWSLIRGEVRLSRVILRDSSVTVFAKSDLFTAHHPGAKTGFQMEILHEIPIDELVLENMTIMGRMDPQGLLFKISQLDIDVVNLYNSIYLYFGSPSVQLKPAGPYPTMNIELQGRGLLDSSELRLSALKIKADQSFLVASGLVNGDFTKSKVETVQLNMRTHINLPDVANWIRVLPNPPKVAALLGTLDLNADAGFTGSIDKNPKLGLELETKGLQIDKFHVGDIEAHGALGKDALTIQQLKVKNDAGTADINKVKITWKPNLAFEGETDVQGLELHSLLEDLGVHHVPVHVNVVGKAPCHGSYIQHLSIECDAELSGSDLVVTSVSSAKTIVKAKQFFAKGKVSIDEQKVSYQADAWMSEKSKGRSDGVIDYDKGFVIHYEGDNLDFKDINNLVDLKFEGGLKVKGSTEGNSDYATVEMKVNSKNLWFEDFGVGDLTTNVAYKAGHLYLRDSSGLYGNSRYQGNVDIDLPKDQLTVNAKMDFVDLRDLRSLLMRRLPIPVDLTGTGSGQMKGWGPLNIEKLNYQVSSEFYRGTVAREGFETLRFDFTGENGVARSKRIELTKANGQLEMRGILKPAWTIDAVLVGRALRLEQSELINSFGFDLQGQTDFNFVMRGPLRSPQMELNGRLSKVIIADQPQDDSNFRMDISSDHIIGSGQFLGNKIQTQVVYPLAPKLPFALELKTQKWDFANLFALVSRSSNASDFQTSMTMETKLHSDDGGFWNSSGLVEVKDLKIRHGADEMKSQGPMKLTFNHGAISSENFAVTSGENFLRLHMANSTREKLNGDINGKMNLSLLGLVTPFISDLRGNLALSVDMKGAMDKPLLSGSVFIDKAYVKFRDFPHAFTDVRADLLFNQQSLLINALRADLGGGHLSAEGHLAFIAHDKVPVDVKGSFSDVTLNIPENFRSRGSGTVAITGEKFPYKMGIHYDITNGDVTAEFAQNGGGSVKASPYLPKFVQIETFDPFLFDLNLVLKKPVLINNALLHAQIQGQMRVEGVPSDLTLTGTLSTLPGGRVFFRTTPFDIVSASAEYNGDPPNNPVVSVTATTHQTEVVLDQSHMEPIAAVGGVQAPIRQLENQYDITMLVQGHVQPTPTITLTSQPALSQRDIVSLLALGMTPTALDEQRQQQAGGTTALGTALLQQPVGKKLKDSLGVDLRVSTAPPTAADPTAAPMVTFSKQWTPKFSASASSTFSQLPTNSVKLEYKVNRNASVVGSWEDRDPTTTVFQDAKDVPTSIFGLDLEYKFQFK